LGEIPTKNPAPLFCFLLPLLRPSPPLPPEPSISVPLAPLPAELIRVGDFHPWDQHCPPCFNRPLEPTWVFPLKTRLSPLFVDLRLPPSPTQRGDPFFVLGLNNPRPACSFLVFPPVLGPSMGSLFSSHLLEHGPSSLPSYLGSFPLIGAHPPCYLEITALSPPHAPYPSFFFFSFSSKGLWVWFHGLDRGSHYNVIFPLNHIPFPPRRAGSRGEESVTF